MFNNCCVAGCNSRRDFVKLIQFPKTEIGRHKWSKCASSGEQKSFSDLRKLYVCVKHFEKRFLTAKSRVRLGGYPTLFTASEIASGVPETLDRDTENLSTNIDHSYCKYVCNEHNYSKRRSTTTPMEDDIKPSCSQTLQPHADSVLENIALTEEDIMSTCSRTIQPHTVSALDNIATLTAITKDVEMQPSTSTSKGNSLITPNASTPKKGRKHLIHRTAQLTPNCRKLYKLYNKSKRKFDFCKKAKKYASSFSTETSFEKIAEGIPTVARKLIWMQIKQSKKSNKGRRFDEEEKLICLSILKQSPKCYRFLRKIFILPTKTTLNKFISEIKMEAGINPNIFEAVTKEVNSWNERKRFCSIIFDEVALESGITYNKYKDVIEGFVELEHKINDFADHALVFMLQGAIEKWQQSIAFYFCKGQTSAVYLKQIMSKIIVAVADTGLIPVALICDQGTAFCSALKSLQEESKREQILAGGPIDDVIIINNCYLSVVYDPPHLLKGLRNNFINKNIKFDGKLAKWTDFVEVYKTDCRHASIRLLHKLNDEHIIPEKIKKMKLTTRMEQLSALL